LNSSFFWCGVDLPTAGDTTLAAIEIVTVQLADENPAARVKGHRNRVSEHGLACDQFDTKTWRNSKALQTLLRGLRLRRVGGWFDFTSQDEASGPGGRQSGVAKQLVAGRSYV
jgi:hypothetical protein